jgi:hypothetical protein
LISSRQLEKLKEEQRRFAMETTDRDGALELQIASI